MRYRAINGIFWGLLLELITSIISVVLITLQLTIQFPTSNLLFALPTYVGYIAVYCSLRCLRKTNSHFQKASLFQLLRIIANIAKYFAKQLLIHYPPYNSTPNRIISFLIFVLEALASFYMFYGIAELVEVHKLPNLAHRLRMYFFLYISYPFLVSFIIALPVMIHYNYPDTGAKINALLSYNGWAVLISACMIISVILAYGYMLYLIRLAFKQLNADSPHDLVRARSK